MITAMGFDQYHEPANELPSETRTFARLCASLTEEAEAIGWYEQRLALEPDATARAIMRDAQGEEFKHFCMASDSASQNEQVTKAPSVPERPSSPE